MIVRAALTAALFASLACPSAAQAPATPEPPAAQPAEPAPASPSEPPARPPIRNAPNPRALEFAAYIFSAANVCGYRIGTEAFEALLARQNVRPADVAPRGPFGNRVQTMFALMSNQIALNREQACLAVAGEYGPEGNIARNVLLPAMGEAPATGAPAKPAE